MLRRTAATALVLAGITVPANAADYCVDSQDPECQQTLALALAQPDRTRIELREPQTGTFTDGGVAVEILGSSIAADTTAPALTLTAAGSTLHDTEVQGLDLAGRAEAVVATAALTMQQGAVLLRSTAQAGVHVAGDVAGLDDVAITGGLETDGAVLARHLTVTGGLQADSGPLEMRSSTIDGLLTVAPEATVTSLWSQHEASESVTATDRVEPGASLVDAGDPDPLTLGEPFHDLAGDTRVADGDGDGVARRDIGAVETQPAAVPLPEGNVLANPGAETGLEGWGGTFVAADYGDPFLPNLKQAAALGGGGAFFSAGEAETADLFQRIDLSASGRAVDLGGATAAFSALLGGYGADADSVAAVAVFKDPENNDLGRITLPGVDRDQRGRATNLLHRAATAAIPVRTRAIDVMVHAERVAADPPVPETYTDAYADNLALVLSVPGVPVDPPVDPDEDPPIPNLKPFAGISVLTGQPSVGRGGAAKVRLACASDTVLACSGTIELHAKLPRATTRTRISKRTLFALAPGEARNARVKLLVAARKRLGRRRYLSARLIAIARDGQGVQREKTVPVRLKLPRRR